MTPPFTSSVLTGCRQNSHRLSTSFTISNVRPFVWEKLVSLMLILTRGTPSYPHDSSAMIHSLEWIQLDIRTHETFDDCPAINGDCRDS